MDKAFKTLCIVVVVVAVIALLVCVMLVLSAPVHAAEVYKCTDASGVTYQDHACSTKARATLLSLEPVNVVDYLPPIPVEVGEPQRFSHPHIWHAAHPRSARETSQRGAVHVLPSRYDASFQRGFLGQPGFGFTGR